MEMAFFLIKLLSRKQMDSLWEALGIVLEFMPYESARYVLNEKREGMVLIIIECIKPQSN